LKVEKLKFLEPISVV